MLKLDLPEDYMQILRQIRALPDGTDDSDLSKQCIEIVQNLVSFFEGYAVSANGFDDVMDMAGRFRSLCGDQLATDFYTAPASTHYHDAFHSGLVRHSLKVLRNLFLLAPVMLPDTSCRIEGPWLLYYTVMGLFHDLCKAGMYEVSSRNVKNEETGRWEKVPYFKSRDNYVSLGHGTESLYRISLYINLPYPCAMAVVWHMGAFGETNDSGRLREMRSALDNFPEVFLLQTADMLSTQIVK